MEHPLNKHEIICKLPKHLIAELKKIMVRKKALGEMLDYLVRRHEHICAEEQAFWDKVHKEYMLGSNMPVYVDFQSGELRRA